MHNRKSDTALLLIVLVVCALFFGCSSKKENSDGFTDTAWNAAEVEPEYLTEWPENVFTEKITKPQNGTIDYVIDGSNSGRYGIFIKDISSEECSDYIKSLKDIGYSEINTAGNGVSVGTMLEREDAYLSVSYADSLLGILVTFKD